MEQINCAHVPLSAFKELEKERTKLFHILLFNINFILCYFLIKENEIEKLENFVDLLIYQKGKQYNLKTWILRVKIEEEWQEIFYHNEKTKKVFFNFNKIKEEIDENIEKLISHFPEITYEEEIEIREDSTVFQIYQYIVKTARRRNISKMNNEKNKEKVVKPQKEPMISESNNLEEKKIKRQEDVTKLLADYFENGERRIPKKIKIKGKIYNIPVSTWKEYGLFCWKDFEKIVKKSLIKKIKKGGIEDEEEIVNRLKTYNLPEDIKIDNHLDLLSIDHRDMLNNILANVLY